MNVQTVISDMKHILPEKRDTITKDTPVYRVLKRHYLHNSVIQLALALGENRLLRYINKLSIDKDFDTYGLKVCTSIVKSDFFRSVYEEIVGEYECMTDIIVYDDVDVHIDLTYEAPKSIVKKYGMCIPMITFMIPERKINITRGVVKFVRTSKYKELKFEDATNRLCGDEK